MAGGIIDSLMYAVGFKLNTKGLKDGDKKIKGLTASVTRLGIAAGATLGAAAIGIGTAAINAAGKFESAMTSMQNATGMTAQQLEETKGIAKDLYAQNYGESWDDLGQSIASVKQITGMTGGALEGATKNAIALRNTFGYEVPESIRTADTLMKNFGVTSDQAFSLIAQGKQNGLDFSGEMLDSLNEYSTQFKSLGFNANQMFDTLAAGSASGAFNLDKVGDAVKEFNLRARDITNKATLEGFKMLGFDAQKMVATFAKGGPAAQKAFTQVVQGIKSAKDPMRQNQIATDLFGTQFEDLQAGVITAMGSARNQFDMTRDAMGKLNATKFTSIWQVFGFLGRQIETYLLIPIGEKLLPYLDMFGQWVTSHQAEISAFGSLIADKVGAGIGIVVHWVQLALPYLKQFGSIAGPMLGQLADKAQELWTAIQPVAIMIGKQLVQAAVDLWPEIQNIASQMAGVAVEVYKWEPFIPIVSGIAAAFLTYKTYMFGVAAATKAVTTAQKIGAAVTKGFAAAQAALNAVMAMNPILLITMALVGLVVGLTIAYKRSDKFRAFVDKMWKGIRSAASATLNFFKVTVPKAFQTAFDAVTGFLKRWGVVILAGLAGPLFLMAALVYKYWDQIKAATIKVFSAIGAWLGSVWSGIKSTIFNAASAIWVRVTTAWKNIKTSISSAMAGIKGIMSTAWNGIVSAVDGVGQGIVSRLSGAWSSVKSSFSSAVNWIINKFNGMLSSLNGISIKNPLTGKEIAGVNIPLIPMIDGSHKNGLSRVPFDGYIAQLHKDEGVLTAEENKARLSPESAPARSSAGGTQPVIKMPAVNLNINIAGNADEKTARQIGDIVDEKVRDIIESVLRAHGLEVEYG
ncbi:phage tail tape measure protein [Paenibacillus rhizophilus]|uniref:Phage tail tape measure protein domain-containing protein n=1 Tax=Paenibacillus rhizophilus TaxID=1850366 RepID=A0A3N9P878_9BACL|nr:phage tail tape measure protein [Paenibacillus rhizophilus]RQW11845.1 hypothetical protein EH198_09215 [Paenibacillus rhizophilus]